MVTSKVIDGSYEGKKVKVIKAVKTLVHNDYSVGDIFTVKDEFLDSICTTTGLMLWKQEVEILED